MRQKKHKPEEIVAKLRQVDELLSQGRPSADVTTPRHDASRRRVIEAGLVRGLQDRILTISGIDSALTGWKGSRFGVVAAAQLEARPA